MKLLRIDSGARRNSVSRQLTSRLVQAWKKENPKGEVIERDWATTHLPLITDEWTLAAYSDPASLSISQKHVLAPSNTLVEELLAADTIVIGAPIMRTVDRKPARRAAPHDSGPMWVATSHSYDFFMHYTSPV